MSALVTKGLTGNAIALITNGLLNAPTEPPVLVGCLHGTLVVEPSLRGVLALESSLEGVLSAEARATGMIVASGTLEGAIALGTKLSGTLEEIC